MQDTYKIKWMSCASCAHHIEKSLGKMPGVESCEVNFATETAKVVFDETKTDFDAMKKVVDPLGYQLVQNSNSKVQSSEWKMQHENHIMSDWTMMSGEDHSMHTGLNQSKEEKLKELQSMKQKIFIVMPFVVLSFIYMILDIGWQRKLLPMMSEWLYELFHHLFPLLATYVLFVIGKQYIIALRRFIKTGVATMETLIGLGTVVGFVYSFIVTAFEWPLAPYLDTSIHYYDVVIVVIGFIYYGKYLETRSKLQTGEAIEKLLNLQAKTAIVERDGHEQEISIDQVRHDDIVIIKPWSKIPVDGIIMSGMSSIDESMITGESMPVDKKEWDKVIGWTMNKQWFMKIKATSLGSDSMLAHIITMVQDAQWSKAPIQKLADQISAVFVPIVLVIAFVSLIVWIITGNVMIGIVAFVSVLIIACPCALWLATPTAIIVGVGKWAEMGILIKNAESLQKLHKVTTVIFDKTGTITKWQPELVDYIGDNRVKDLQILASLEKQSEHPLAQAIVKAAGKENIWLFIVSDFAMRAWKGVEGMIDNQTWYAGNITLMEEIGVQVDTNKIVTLTREWKTPIFLANKDWVKAIFGIADTIKDSAKQAIADLHTLGIKTVMLTGDNQQTAEYIARLVGIDIVKAQVLPDQKADAVQSLQQQWQIVAMCGDGVNDSPALARADVGIAMGTGTDVAIETADITLLAWDISKLVQAIKLSRRTMRTIKQNLFWAFAYNIIGIPLAAGLFYPLLLNPIFAGLAMAMSSVSVVTNSLRLKHIKL